MAQKYTSKELFDWMTEKARSASSMRDNMFRMQSQQRAYGSIGRMYFFKYDPKTKDKLPIYDVYPLVFPIEDYADGFLGLNIHYLDASSRLRILDKLSGFATSKNYTDIIIWYLKG